MSTYGKWYSNLRGTVINWVTIFRLASHVEDSNKLPVLIFPEGTCINNTWEQLSDQRSQLIYDQGNKDHWSHHWLDIDVKGQSNLLITNTRKELIEEKYYY